MVNLNQQCPCHTSTTFFLDDTLPSIGKHRTLSKPLISGFFRRWNDRFKVEKTRDRLNPGNGNGRATAVPCQVFMAQLANLNRASMKMPEPAAPDHRYRSARRRTLPAPSRYRGSDAG